MTKSIDNTQLIRDRILKFDNKGDFYFVLILKRRKDTKGHMLEGVNEDNRLIKHYFIYDNDYFDKKIDSIKRLCVDNNARAYILPQRRNDSTILLELHKKTGELIEERLKNLMHNHNCSCNGGFGNNGIHFDHLIRSCVAGCHISDRPRWVIDIDYDNDNLKKLSKDEHSDYVYFLVGRIALIRKEFGQKAVFDCTLVPTPHGVHIVTEPFNKQALNTPKNKEDKIQYWQPDWLKQDAMTILYSPEI